MMNGMIFLDILNLSYRNILAIKWVERYVMADAFKKDKIKKLKTKREFLTKSQLGELERQRDIQIKDARTICDRELEFQKMRGRMANQPKLATPFDKVYKLQAD
jgi:hypothetical protein